MALRMWLLAVILSAAPAFGGPSNKTATAPTPKTVTVAPFGDVTIDDGAIMLMDRGNGDKRVHFMTVSRDYKGSTRSRDDVSGPPSGERHDAFPIDADERAQLEGWTTKLWKLAPHGRKSYKKVRPKSGDFFEWAIVVRRGDDVRVIEGGVNGSGAAHQADFLESPLDFLDMHF
jgi:hypothetical protein